MSVVRNDSAVQMPDKRNLAYAEYGDTEGAPVFLFHGLPGSRLSWGFLPGNPFPSGLRFIAPDRPGYGQSDPKPHRTLLNWADDVGELADELGIDRFAVVGVSGGGPGALACAWKMPQRVAVAGVVASPAPSNAPGVFAGVSKTNRFFMNLAWYVPWLSSLNVRLLTSVIRRDPARYINAMKYKMHAEDKILLHRPEIEEMLIKDFTEALSRGPHGMMADMSANHGYPWGFSLEEIRVKVLFWFCELDHSVPPAMGKYLSTTVPNNEATFVANAGHLWILAHLHEVLDAVKQIMLGTK